MAEEKKVQEDKEKLNIDEADLKEEVKEETKKEKKDKFKKELEAKDEEIAKVKAELENFKDKYYRAIADMDNQRKQYQKEYSNTLKYASGNLAEKLIPSFEMFSMVIESVDNLPNEVQPYVQGFTMIYKQMVQALESEGITEISCKVGDEFDHNLHSAMEAKEVEDESQVNKVLKVIRKGYMNHDRLIKPTTVIVGKKKEIKEENKAEA